LVEAALTKAGLLSAKAMINREHDLPIHKQAQVLRISRWQCLLSNAPDAGSRPRDHATSRPAAFWNFLSPARDVASLLVAEGCRSAVVTSKTLMQRMG